VPLGNLPANESGQNRTEQTRPGQIRTELNSSRKSMRACGQNMSAASSRQPVFAIVLIHNKMDDEPMNGGLRNEIRMGFRMGENMLENAPRLSTLLDIGLAVHQLCSAGNYNFHLLC